MAEAFLSQLLRAENSVQPHSGERCIICLAECGTLCDKTGIVEWEIRLPCRHTVGSRCIASWLGPTGAAKNSCPVCRYVFFPTQSLVDLEPLTLDDPQEPGFRLSSPFDSGVGNPHEEEEEEEEMQEHTINEEVNNHNTTDLSTIKTMCETYCHRLNLTPRFGELSIGNLSQRFAEKLYAACILEGHSAPSIAAISVFVASHVAGAPRTVDWVSMMCSVEAQDIANLYCYIYYAQIGAELLDEEMLAMVSGGDMVAVLERLPEPRML